MSKNRKKLMFLTKAALIAALYTVLTYVAVAMNLAYGPIQFRFSEALTVLPIFTPAAIPGLAIGCFLSNIASPFGFVDWIFGTSATLLAAILSRALRNIRFKGIPILSVLMPVIMNAVIIGFEITCISDVSGNFAIGNFSLAVFFPIALSVGIGELVVCAALGIPLIVLIGKTGLSRYLESGGE